MESIPSFCIIICNYFKEKFILKMKDVVCCGCSKQIEVVLLTVFDILPSAVCLEICKGHSAKTELCCAAVFWATRRGLQRCTLILRIINGLFSPTEISAKPEQKEVMYMCKIRNLFFHCERFIENNSHMNVPLM